MHPEIVISLTGMGDCVLDVRLNFIDQMKLRVGPEKITGVGNRLVFKKDEPAVPLIYIRAKRLRQLIE